MFAASSQPAGLRPQGPARSVLTALLAGVLLVLSACQGGGASDETSDAGTGVDLAPLSSLTPQDPFAIEGPSTAALSDRSVEPITEKAEPQLPVTVTSELTTGTSEVTVDDTSRIVAFDISGSLSSTIWGLGMGDRLVGRDQAASFPGNDDVEVVTSGGHAINVESVLALRPTVVLTDGSIGPRDVVEQIADAGVPLVVIPRAASFEGAAQQARDVGAALGLADEGELLAERILSEIEEVSATIDDHLVPAEGERLRMAFLYLRGDSGVYFLFGPGSGADDLVQRLGGVDVGTDQGWREYTPLTDEAIVAADPDLLLVMTKGLESAGGVDGLLSSKPALALTTAGQKRRIVDMADTDVLSFGPRSAGVLDALARAVYAPGEDS